MKKVLCAIVAIAAFAGCESQPSAPPAEEMKPAAPAPAPTPPPPAPAPTPAPAAPEGGAPPSGEMAPGAAPTAPPPAGQPAPSGEAPPK